MRTQQQPIHCIQYNSNPTHKNNKPTPPPLLPATAQIPINSRLIRQSNISKDRDRQHKSHVVYCERKKSNSKGDGDRCGGRGRGRVGEWGRVGERGYEREGRGRQQGKEGFGGIVQIHVNIQDLVRHKNVSNVSRTEVKRERAIGQKNTNTFATAVQTKIALNTSARHINEGLNLQCTQQLKYIIRSSPPPRQQTISKPKQKPSLPPSPLSSTLPQPTPPTPSTPSTGPCPLTTFQLLLPSLTQQFHIQHQQYLSYRQHTYHIPNYLPAKQPNFTWKMRACVIEWMMEVAHQFERKRETFHLAVCLFDRFLAMYGVVGRSGFQAVGATCLYIADKLEQQHPRCCAEYTTSTGNLIPPKKLLQLQITVYKTLNYLVNPITLYRWSNKIMMQWDNFVDYCSQEDTKNMLCDIEHEKDGRQFQFQFCFGRVLGQDGRKFKEFSEDGYANFRLLTQLIDCSTLDIQTLSFSPKTISLSFLYLQLLKQYKIYPTKTIYQQFPTSSTYLFSDQNTLNPIFRKFLHFSFSYLLEDLLPSIQYCAGFFRLPDCLDRPVAVVKREGKEMGWQMGLEEFESFQTFDRNFMRVVMWRRSRQMY